MKIFSRVGSINWLKLNVQGWRFVPYVRRDHCETGEQCNHASIAKVSQFYTFCVVWNCHQRHACRVCLQPSVNWTASGTMPTTRRGRASRALTAPCPTLPETGARAARCGCLLTTLLVKSLFWFNCSRSLSSSSIRYCTRLIYNVLLHVWSAVWCV